jgi:hypothetical protein
VTPLAHFTPCTVILPDPLAGPARAAALECHPGKVTVVIDCCPVFPRVDFATEEHFIIQSAIEFSHVGIVAQLTGYLISDADLI